MSDSSQTADDLELIFYPDPRLTRKAAPVEAIDDELRAKVEAMVKILHEAKGIGLAATQVGWMSRLCLINPTGNPGEDEVLINPEIVAESGRSVGEEGCLSLPDVYASVTRAETVRVRYTGLDGEERERETTGLEATVIQHEVDHLEGILFITKASPADRLKMKKQLKALEAEFEERGQVRS